MTYAQRERKAILATRWGRFRNDLGLAWIIWVKHPLIIWRYRREVARFDARHDETREKMVGFYGDEARMAMARRRICGTVGNALRPE